MWLSQAISSLGKALTRSISIKRAAYIVEHASLDDSLSRQGQRQLGYQLSQGLHPAPPPLPQYGAEERFTVEKFSRKKDQHA